LTGIGIGLDAVIALLAVAAFGLAGAVAVFAIGAARRQGRQSAEREQHEDAIEQRMAELARIQAETAGRLQALGEGLGGRQAELARVVAERLDAVSTRLGHSMEETTRQTVERLQSLNERIAVIDHAQKSLAELSGQVVSLRDVLGNKQARGAFGQARMEAIVADGLPKGMFAFQFTLSNNTRPDCVIFLPDQRPLAVDAKFPLEAITALREARTEDDRQRAAQRLRQDVWKHIADIAEKYLLPGETQDMALMFVPSESVYAELYDGFDDLVQKAYRARVVIVSPSLLMLAIQVMQQILKDARMRAAADLIRAEVGRMVADVGRLQDRVLKLQQHYGQGGEDLRQILISAEKIGARASRIDALDFGDGATHAASVDLESVAMTADKPAFAARASRATLKLQAGE
jgi:DNA recombination protein RmuC